MLSSRTSSMMERSPRAPVSATLARCAMATRAAWEKCSRMPSTSKSARYLRYHEPRNRCLQPGRTAAPQPQTGPLRGSAARGRVRSVARGLETQPQEASVVSRGTAKTARYRARHCLSSALRGFVMTCIISASVSALSLACTYGTGYRGREL